MTSEIQKALDDLWQRIDIPGGRLLDIAQKMPPKMRADEYRAGSLKWLETWTGTFLSAAQILPPELFELVASHILRFRRKPEEGDPWTCSDWRDLAFDIVEAWVTGGLAELPTLQVGQGDDLKLDDSHHRVWLLRVKPYLVSIEKHQGQGRWKVIWEGVRIFDRTSIGLQLGEQPHDRALDDEIPRLEVHLVSLSLDRGGRPKVYEAYVAAQSFEHAQQILQDLSWKAEEKEDSSAFVASVSITAWARKSIPERALRKPIYSPDGEEYGTVGEWLENLR